MPNSSSGFTLIELMLALLIAGIIASLVLPSLDGVKEAAYEAAVKSEIRRVAFMQEAYHAEHGVYMDSASMAPVYVWPQGIGGTYWFDGAQRAYTAHVTHKGLDTENEFCVFAQGDMDESDLEWPVTPGGEPLDETGVIVCD